MTKTSTKLLLLLLPSNFMILCEDVNSSDRVRVRTFELLRA